MNIKPSTVHLILLIILLASNGIVNVAMARDLHDPLGHNSTDELRNELVRLSWTIRRGRPLNTPPSPLLNKEQSFLHDPPVHNSTDELRNELVRLSWTIRRGRPLNTPPSPLLNRQQSFLRPPPLRPLSPPRRPTSQPKTPHLPPPPPY